MLCINSYIILLDATLSMHVMQLIYILYHLSMDRIWADLCRYTKHDAQLRSAGMDYVYRAGINDPAVRAVQGVRYSVRGVYTGLVCGVFEMLEWDPRDHSRNSPLLDGPQWMASMAVSPFSACSA